jgi:hypothetical protein
MENDDLDVEILRPVARLRLYRRLVSHLLRLSYIGDTTPPRPTRAGSARPAPAPATGTSAKTYRVLGSITTSRNTTFVTWNLMHTALQLHEAGGVPAHGNQRSEWEAGCRFDHPNPEHR